MSVVRGGGLAAVCCECSERWSGWWQFGESTVRGGGLMAVWCEYNERGFGWWHLIHSLPS